MKIGIVFNITSPHNSENIVGLEKVILPCVDGVASIHKGHSPLFSTLKQGEIHCVYIDEGEESTIKFKLTSGMVSVVDNSVEVVTKTYTKL